MELSNGRGKNANFIKGLEKHTNFVKGLLQKCKFHRSVMEKMRNTQAVPGNAIFFKCCENMRISSKGHAKKENFVKDRLQTAVISLEIMTYIHLCLLL